MQKDMYKKCKFFKLIYLLFIRGTAGFMTDCIWQDIELMKYSLYDVIPVWLFKIYDIKVDKKCHFQEF